MRRSRVARFVVPVAMLSVLAASAAAPVAGSAAAQSSMRDSIVSIAQRELSDTSRNYEFRGSDNCTFYSGEVTGWPLCGPDGWRGGLRNKDHDYAWCANFTKYIWRESGVRNLRGVDAWAYSFAKYGAANGTLYLAGSGYRPRPGDAVVFDWDAPYIDLSQIMSLNHKASRDINHVGIVISYADDTVVTIEGNADDRVTRKTYAYSDSMIRGYISPANADPQPPSRFAAIRR